MAIAFKIKQEQWLSPAERASVSAISLRHILHGLPWVYAPGTIAVKRIQCLSNAQQHVQAYYTKYTSIFNRFPVIQPVSLKVRHFSTFLHILASPGYDPRTITVNFTWMERGFNAGQTHSSIYTHLSSTVYELQRDIIIFVNLNFAIFPTSLHLTPPLEVFPLEFQEKFGPRKLESWATRQ